MILISHDGALSCWWSAVMALRHKGVLSYVGNRKPPLLTYKVLTKLS